jgi:hypothetical protein
MATCFGPFNRYAPPWSDSLAIIMEKVYSEEVPWISGLWLELWKSTGKNNYHIRLRKNEVREICDFTNGIPIFKENTNIPIVGTQAQQLTNAEKLCLSVMPKNYGISGEIADIMKDPWWQKILDYISVHYVMSV